jgi:hypothetical protein
MATMPMEGPPTGQQQGQVSPADVLPPDHQLGMKIPKGGSMCANCEYLQGDSECGNEGFQQWNGSPQLPDPPDEYCCDLYEPGEDKPSGSQDMIKALQSPQGRSGSSPLNANAPGQIDEGR